MAARPTTDRINAGLTRIAAAIGLVVAVSIPTLYLLTAYQYESERVEAETELAADRVSQRIYVNPNLWRFEAHRIEELLDQLHNDREQVFLTIIDEQGQSFLEVGTPPGFPAITRRTTLSDGLNTVGTMVIAEGMRSVIARTALATVLSTALALAVYLALKVLPLRALTRTITHLVRSQSALQSARDDLQKLNAELELKVNERTEELKQAHNELVRAEKLSVLGQLTATVAHELRNPLGTIRTSVYTIEKKSEREGVDIKRTIERVTRNISRCDKIITELLDFTRTTTPQLEPVELDTWLASVLEEQHQAAPIQITRNFCSNAAQIMIDPDRMRRAIINIYDNACQAMLDADHQKPNMPSTLSINTDNGENRVRIEISDNGPGMTDEVKQHLFEPLYSTKGFGVGLGLPIVKQIVEQHGGDISIDSELGRGTNVCLSLPIQPAPAQKFH